MLKFAEGQSATLRLLACARLMVSTVSLHSGSEPGTGAKAGGVFRLKVQVGVSTTQLAFRPWTSCSASGIHACQVGSYPAWNSIPAQKLVRGVTVAPTTASGLTGCIHCHAVTTSC